MADFAAISKSMNDEFLALRDVATPYLLLDLDKVAHNFTRLKAAMPDAMHHYAIKANPEAGVLKTLNRLGGFFEVASLNEVKMCLAAGVDPEKLFYGNPLKKASEIAGAYALGVRRFVFDNILELQKISEFAPGVSVICRIKTDGKGAVSPLSIKFGCPPHLAAEWLAYAPQIGLTPIGVSFHTGSQQLTPEAWDAPMRNAADIFKTLAGKGIYLQVVNVGGGFPVSYRDAVPDISVFAEAILGYATRYFDTMPTLYTEPGRYMVGDAGHILSEVVLVSPDYQHDGYRWVYLDIGRYGGLVEEKIDYPLVSDKSGPVGPVILAGQTCDSNDVIYRECFNYELPLDLKSGDKIILMNTGAYTTTYSTTLNGFDTLKAYCKGER